MGFRNRELVPSAWDLTDAAAWEARIAVLTTLRLRHRYTNGAMYGPSVRYKSILRLDHREQGCSPRPANATGVPWAESSDTEAEIPPVTGPSQAARDGG